jgi:outer membrane immunogenic protein
LGAENEGRSGPERKPIREIFTLLAATDFSRLVLDCNSPRRIDPLYLKNLKGWVTAMRMIKFALLTSLSAFALGAPVLAADMGVPMKAPMAPPPLPAPTWTGCYVDGGFGYGVSNIDHNFQSTLPQFTTVQTTSGGRGWLGTVGGGCDYQFSPGSGFGNWVVGAFGDYQFMNIHRNFQETLTSGNLEESSAWDVGGRIGYLVTPNVFTYWNGGYSQTHFDGVNLSLSFAPFTPNAFTIGSHTYSGWFLGGGTEISLSGLFGMPLPPGLFWRSEYRFYSYNSAAIPVFSTGAVATAGLAGVENMKPYVQTVTTALVWRFGWLGR